MRPEVTAVIVVLLVMAGLAGVVLGGAYQSRTSTVTAFTTSTLVSTTTLTYIYYATTSTISGATITVDNPNLELLAKVYPATVASGQNVSINMGLYNPLAASYTVVSTTWQPPGFGCPSSFPLAFNIYQGHYDYVSVTGATPLLLHNASIILPCFVGYNSTYTFDPNSDIVLDSSMIGQTTHAMNYTSVMSGYYVQNQTSYRFTFQEFTAGYYTVLIFDRWGQQVLGYFAVA